MSRTRFVQRVVATVLAQLLFLLPLEHILVRAEEARDRVESEEGATEASSPYSLAQAAKRFAEEKEDRSRLKSSGGKVDSSLYRRGKVGAGAATAPTTKAKPASLPTGPDRSGVTPQALRLPSAEGSLQGMGESFQPNLAAGGGSYSVPISLPSGRAGVQPSLALTYSTGTGNGSVGFGWSLGIPFIARQTDKGVPRYRDQGTVHADEDGFIFNGGQELVAVDATAIATVFGAPVPSEVSGWQEYRAKIEGAFMRFFRSPDSQRWVVFAKDGSRMDFGALPTSVLPSDATDTKSSMVRNAVGERTFSWSITRTADAHGSTIHYRYKRDLGQVYLTDIFYGSPASCGGASYAQRLNCTAPTAQYAVRVGFTYGSRPDVYSSFVSGFKVSTAQRLERIDISAAQESAGQRFLVRAYALGYYWTSFHSLLITVAPLGRPAEQDPVLGIERGATDIPEDEIWSGLPYSTVPPFRFSYTGVLGSEQHGLVQVVPSIRSAETSPPNSLDEARTDLFDMNADGLPDVIVTDPSAVEEEGSAGAIKVFYNGYPNGVASFSGGGSFSPAQNAVVDEDVEPVLSLSNPNIRPIDVDGDARSDFVHMPNSGAYSFYKPQLQGTGGNARTPPTVRIFEHKSAGPLALDQRLDLGRDADNIQFFDVNHDSRIDAVRTAGTVDRDGRTGTVLQTFLNLGFHRDGEGLFGSLDSMASSEFSSAPIESCVWAPRGGPGPRFDDPETRIADMNGDGLDDIVWVRRGRVVYWPARGMGTWGAQEDPMQAAGPCDRVTPFDAFVEMATPPSELNPELDGVQLQDMDNDGSADIVEVGFNFVAFYFNLAGQGFAARVVVDGTPENPAFTHRVRLVDIDGSGTTDVLYGAGGRYRWLDPMGGQRPRLLSGVLNSFGAATAIEYGTSAEDHLRDSARQCDGTPFSDCFAWATQDGGMPFVSTVVRSVQTSDRFDAIGREVNRQETRYAYHLGYYNGREHEFRGYGVVDALQMGDPTNPAMLTRTYFHQGRAQLVAGAGGLFNEVDVRESLKGLPKLVEVSDALRTVFLKTVHSTYAVRSYDIVHAAARDQLGAPHTQGGVRSIEYAFPAQTDEYLYETTPFSRVPLGTSLVDVVDERVTAQNQFQWGATVTSTTLLASSNYAHIQSVVEDLANQVSYVDRVGHVTRSVARGAIEDTGVTTQQPIEPIEVHSSYVRINDSACGGTGWLWRTGASHVAGHNSSGQDLKATTFRYNACGDLELSSETVQRAPHPSGGFYNFEFAGDSFGALGFTPPSSSAITASEAYDVWGQVVRTCSGADLHASGTCLGESTTTRDAAYSQFPVSVTTAVGPVGTPTGLTTTATWDRGIGSVLSVTDPNGHTSSATYDGFGRVTATVLPDVLGCSTSGQLPTTRLRYRTSDQGSVPFNSVWVQTERSCATSDVQDTVIFSDGLGRTRATIQRSEREGAWVRGGLAVLDKKGAVFAAIQPDFLWNASYDPSNSGDSTPLNLPPMPSGPEGEQAFRSYTHRDSFGRAVYQFAEDNALTVQSYHALSTDLCDPLDHGGGEFAGTCTTTRVDGHGRVIDQERRTRDPDTGTLERHRLFSYYRADGVLLALVRAKTPENVLRPAYIAAMSSSLPYPNEAQRFAYDTAGRRLASIDRNTQDPDAAGDGSRYWRYLYNDVNDLVAVRDPRGCGQNFFYDLGGRLWGEQYVSCAEAQTTADGCVDTLPAQLISAGLQVTGAPVHVRNYFDTAPGWASAIETDDRPMQVAGTLGLPTGQADRAQRTLLAYDARGQVVWTGKQIALAATVPPLSGAGSGDVPGTSEGGVSTSRPNVSFDAEHTYQATTTFDHAGRTTTSLLPVDPDFTDASGDPTGAPRIGGSVRYNTRGLPEAASVHIGGVEYPVVASVHYTRDGLVAHTVLGDDLQAGRAPTESQVVYDARRRPVEMLTTRTPVLGILESNSAKDLRRVSVVMNQRLDWDLASNLKRVVDLRSPEEWPAGSRPQTVDIRHDALYRVIGAEFSYTHDDGSLSPLDVGSDWRETSQARREDDPMRSNPAPMLVAQPEYRPASLAYRYDWLANLVEWNDDAHAFYERSIGAITNGSVPGISPSPGRPSALYVAEDLTGPSPEDRGGWLGLTYGRGGNVLSMTVHAQCADRESSTCESPSASTPAAKLSELASDCLCATEQHYEYRWDELNRLAEARRYDRSTTTGAPGAWQLKVRQRHRYDGGNRRTIRQTLSSDDPEEPEGGRFGLDVLPGDFERRGLALDSDTYTAVEGSSESQYIVAGARVVWTQGTLAPSEVDRDHRITFGFADIIGSTNAVVDLVSGELLETTTFYPNGARESYRLAEGEGFDEVPLEPAGFTGKEADEEVGLTYFGERYLVPRIGRWATPDPLQIHASGGGEALNGYHYVNGNLLQARDPLGLSSEDAAANNYSATAPACDPSVQSCTGQSEYVPEPRRGNDAADEKPYKPTEAQQKELDAAFKDGMDYVILDTVTLGLVSGAETIWGGDPYEIGELARSLVTPNIAAPFEAAKAAAREPESHEEALEVAKARGTLVGMAATAGLAVAVGGGGKGSKAAVRGASPVVQGGGLVAHEAAGGHLIARHVGKSTADLAARLAAETRIPAASTFLSRAEAEVAMSGLLDANAARISSWAAAGARGRLTLDGAFSGGAVLMRGASSPTTGSGVRAVLQGNGSGGWNILTGFPLP